MDWDSFNSRVIEEFRANDGHVGGNFEDATLLLLHSTGAKSGKERVTPLMARREGDAWAIFASKGGAPTNPDWFHNLKEHPNTTIEIGADEVEVRARIARGEEYARIWEAQKREWPQFAEYEERADGRQIPVIVLEPR